MSAAVQSRPIKVFISYKRNALPDEGMAKRVRDYLRVSGHEVFIDQEIRIGLKWAEEIERQLSESDFMIVLLTAASSRSEMLIGEVEMARMHASRSGKPAILPVRINFEDNLPHPLNSWLNGIQYAFWCDERDTHRLFEQLEASLTGITACKTTFDVAPQYVNGLSPYASALPVPGGGLDPEDPRYIMRSHDGRALALAVQPGQTLVFKGPRQMGKTSLLVRVIDAALHRGKKAALVDLQLFGHDVLNSQSELYRAFAAALADQIGVEPPTEHNWNAARSQPHTCTTYMESIVLTASTAPVCVAIDEADLLITSPFANDFFGMLRAWHGLRANPLKRHWKKLDLYLVTSTEPALFIEGHQSPFNVGSVFLVERFTFDEVAELNKRHNSPFATSELKRLMELINGHPYLTRLALYEVSPKGNGSTPERLFDEATDEAGPFGPHLRRYLLSLTGMPDLVSAFRDILRGGVCEHRMMYRLEAAGLVIIRSGKPYLSCRLYETYFRERLH